MRGTATSVSSQPTYHSSKTRRPGLMAAVLDRDAAGRLRRKAGIMTVVECGGEVATGHAINAKFAARPHRALEPL